MNRWNRPLLLVILLDLAAWAALFVAVVAWTADEPESSVSAGAECPRQGAECER